MQQLGHDQVGHLVVDGRAKEHDPLVEQSRVEVVLAVAAGVALDHRGDERHDRSVVTRPGVPRSLASKKMSGPPALSLRALTKRYDDGLLALDRFELEVPDGEFFGLLGPNGAGKTTLISAVCNLIRITGGEIEVFGHPHHTLEARRLIGLAAQDVNLDRFLDVEETLMYHGGYYGMSRAEARRRASEMIDVVDLRAKASTRAPKPSGGMRR